MKRLRNFAHIMPKKPDLTFFSKSPRVYETLRSFVRFDRSMTHLVTLIQALLQRHVSFRSLIDGAIDTTTASGELVFHIFSALAQFERRLIQERTQAGLAVARARGKKGGRTPRRAEEPRVWMAYTMYKEQSLTVQDICRVLRISQATFYGYVALGRRAAKTT
jgi:DNA invertase Pin-like site-specific DNA recombinase